MILMCYIMILWSAHCDMWPAQSSEFSIAAHASSKLSKHVTQHALQSASFLYIVVLCQLWLVKLSRFQYYLNCDHMFDLFNCIEVYNCEALLLLSQLIFKLCLWSVKLYSLCHEVKNFSVNLLHSMSRDLLQNDNLLQHSSHFKII